MWDYKKHWILWREKKTINQNRRHLTDWKKTMENSVFERSCYKICAGS